MSSPYRVEIINGNETEFYSFDDYQDFLDSLKSYDD